MVVLTAVILASAAVGSVAAQEEVSNANDLEDIRNDLDGDYVLVDDVDLSGTDNFEPIGVLEDPFTGTLDGNGYNITGLTIERLDDNGVGLFGDTGTGATIRNVTLKDVSVDGKQWVGALVGFNKGDVSDSYATGEVIADTRAGGLVGGNQGRITESYAEGTVTSADIIGGLVGRNEGEVSESYANASVAGFDSVTARDMGGLVGVNTGDIEDSYARGEVLGDEFIGGLVGASDGDIVGSYATGRVEGDTGTGGLVGELNFGGGGATLRDSYWDEQGTTQTQAVGTQSGSPTVTNVDGLQTNEMRGDSAETNMGGLEFTTTWATVTDPDDYPVLVWQVDGEVAPAEFNVTIDSTNSPVKEGETLEANVTVKNTGSAQGTQTVTAEASGIGSNMTIVSLRGNSLTRENFSIQTSAGDAGDYSLAVRSENDTATVMVTVESDGGSDLFTEPLPRFDNPPTNTQELNMTLYEDVNGDGDGLDPTEGVLWWSQLVQNPGDFSDLSKEQIDALDWNGDGSLSPADAVILWSEKVQAQAGS